MKRFQLKSIANKMNKDIDLYNFRKQQNLVVNLNKKEKKKFLNSLLIENDSKPFWENLCIPLFENLTFFEQRNKNLGEDYTF